jgi:hypothetical protein
MEINKKNMMRLCTELQYAKLLLSVHLNDNGISIDYDYMLEVLDIFGIFFKDIPQIKKDIYDVNAKI